MFINLSVKNVCPASRILVSVGFSILILCSTGGVLTSVDQLAVIRLKCELVHRWRYVLRHHCWLVW